MKLDDTLFVIPARGGSKGLPRKNILPLGGKPLICYSIDAARGLADDRDICLSTEDAEIKQVAEDYGLSLPFVRPARLASDTAGSREVLLHALNFYQRNLGRSYHRICRCSPLVPRYEAHLEEACSSGRTIGYGCVGQESQAIPTNLFEEEGGYLRNQARQLPPAGSPGLGTEPFTSSKRRLSRPSATPVRKRDERSRLGRSRHGTRLPAAAGAFCPKNSLSCPSGATAPAARTAQTAPCGKILLVVRE